MAKRKFGDMQEKVIVLEYLDLKEHNTLESLGEKYGCSLGTILNILDRYGVTRKGRGEDKTSRLKRNTGKSDEGGLTISKDSI